MPFQPQSKPKNKKNPSYCSVFEQQKLMYGRQEDWRYDAKLCFVSNDNTTYLKDWKNTNTVVDKIVEWVTNADKSAINELDDLEKSFKKWLDSLSNTSVAQIVNIVKDEFNKKIKTLVEYLKATISPYIQKIINYTQKTLIKLRNMLVATVMNIAVSNEKVADEILKMANKVIDFCTVTKQQLFRIESQMTSFVKYSPFVNKLKDSFSSIKNVLSTITSDIGGTISSVGKNILVRGFLKGIAKWIDAIIEAVNLIVLASDDKTDYSATGKDSYWYHLLKFILALVLIFIGTLLVKCSLIIAIAGGIVLVGISIFEIDSLFVTEVIQLLSTCWKVIAGIVEEIKVYWEEVKVKVGKQYEDFATKHSDKIIDIKNSYEDFMMKNADAIVDLKKIF